MDFFQKAAHLVDQITHHDQPRRDDRDDNDQSNAQYQAQSQTQQPGGYGAPSQEQPAQYQGQSVYEPPPPQPQVQANPEHQNEGFTLPREVLVIIDKYVDNFKPGIAEGVAQEIMEFERATIESLEQHIKAAITGIFKGDFSAFQSNKNIGEFRAIREQPQQYGTNMPKYNYPSPDVVASREGQEDSLPAYGSPGLPFAGSNRGGGAPVPQQDVDEPKKQRNVFESALHKVKEFAKDTAEDVGDDIEREFKGMAAKIGEIADDIEEKVAQIAPDLKAKIGEILHELHLGLAEIMTGAALLQLKKFLGGHINLEEIGKTAVDGVEDIIQGFLGKDTDGPGGRDPAPGKEGAKGAATGLLSDKLSSGLTRVRNNSRVDFRTALGNIEEKLFDSLPDGLKEILSRLLGGNPFDADASVQQHAQAKPEHEGIFREIVDKLKSILERIQHALRDRVLEIVSGGHRRLEDKAWGNVQDAIVTKVQKYVPDVKVQLKDDPQSQQQ